MLAPLQQCPFITPFLRNGSVGPFALEHCRDRARDDLQIEPEGMVADVVHIEAHTFLASLVLSEAAGHIKAYFDASLPDPESSEMSLARVLHLCNKTQLFLAEPGFREKLAAEVQRFERWRRR